MNARDKFRPLLIIYKNEIKYLKLIKGSNYYREIMKTRSRAS